MKLKTLNTMGFLFASIFLFCIPGILTGFAFSSFLISIFFISLILLSVVLMILTELHIDIIKKEKRNATKKR
jgi:hypothetical protein